MEIIVYMILVSLALSFSFLAAFWWANKGRQFDDLASPAIRAVFDESHELENTDKHNEVEQGEKNGAL